ncbi:starch-binding protein [Anaerosporobacter sp.]
MQKTRKMLSSLFIVLVVLFQSTFSAFAMDNTAVQTQETSTQEVTSAAQATSEADASTFSWDNATVYFALSDRFSNGDTSNDHSYGRELDQNGKVYSNYLTEPATFHGGDLKGLTKKVNEGYFTNLGVNAIWITAPYEQIHGWLGADSFRHYAYHGYYTLDYTNVDANMGTAEDLKTFIDTAHENGIRVIFDVVMNHAGYATLKDMNDFNFGSLASNWKDYYYSDSTNALWSKDYLYMNKDSANWANWWGNAWIRESHGFNGYTGSESGDDQTMCLAGLPDFKTETTNDPGIPKLLENKWKSEGRYTQEVTELNKFFSTSGLNRQVSNYQVKWLTDWVREYGVDGFRVDTAKHVQLDVWKTLKEQSVIALKEWKANNPDKALDDLDFWMTGESWGHGVSSSSSYFSNGFDSMINFGFQGVPANMSSLETTYSNYANVINSSSSNVNYLSYISSHDTSLYNRSDLINGGTALLLAPGAVQIFYGDETARPLDFLNCTYTDQKYRSDMNWNSINQTVLAHWQKLGQFRDKHIAIGAGQHKLINSSPYTFSRTYDENGITDGVIVVVGASGATTVDVSSVFGDGTLLTDYYTGAQAKVSNGKVTFTAGTNGVILIEGPNNQPSVWIDQNQGGFYTDAMTVSMNFKNADTATYSLNDSEAVKYVSGDTITFGEGAAFGTVFTLKLIAKNADGITITKTYTFTKEDPDQVLTVHYYKPSSWGTPNIYYYDETVSPKKEGAAWPGVGMTSEGDGWYVYNIPLWKEASVIFNYSGSQIPGAQQAGYRITTESWIKDGVIYTQNPNNPTPIVSIDANEGDFYTDTLTITPTLTGAVTASYTVNGSSETTLVSGDEIVIGEDAAIGTTFVLEIKAVNANGTTTKTYTFTKAEEPEEITFTVHYYKPSSWGTPNIYYYDETVSPKKEGKAWPGTAMSDEGDGWYSYTITGWEKAYVIFNYSGNQIPGAQQTGYLVTTESWIKDGVIYTQNPNNPAPIVSIDANEGDFYTDTLTITPTLTNTVTASYTVNDSSETTLVSGDEIVIGQDAAIGTTFVLKIKAVNANGTTTKTYTFTKAEEPEENTFTVHYYKPSSWGTPNIYYYDETVSPKKEGKAWPGTAMSDEGDGWYSYTITGWEKAYVIFNSNGSQIPSSGQTGYLIKADSWIKDGVITTEKPETTLIAVTFVIKNATTVLGQEVYIAGNIAELGSWNTANAIETEISEYPTWTVTVNLPAGETIQFKGIKKDSSGGVVWESCSNHTYTVPSTGNGAVTVNWS